MTRSPLAPALTAAFAIVLASCANITGKDPGVRTPPTVWSDNTIEYRTEEDIKASDPRFASSHIIVVSHSGIVLLAGEVESEDLKTKAGDIAQNVANVRAVHNELTIGPASSVGTRSNDAWITTKINTKFLAHGAIDSTRIDVTTENGIVYLMGTVSRQQADYAVEVAQTVSGVEKIVKVFEYTD
jgi:osmotically-inducible protein OsmY